MRVIAGEYGSRILAAPKGLATRPTSDRLRETLFNVLAPRIEGASFLDLYAGSGAVGIEALSRGAARVVFVERAAEPLAALRNNLDTLGVRGVAQIRPVSVGAFLHRRRAGASEAEQFDVVFLDPPYDLVDEYAQALMLLGQSGWLARGAVVVAEHRRKHRLEERYDALRRARLLQQGDAALSFYVPEPQAGPA
jgi:16S rRNA (guanine966-N2)-methyltransferase